MALDGMLGLLPRTLDVYAIKKTAAMTTKMITPLPPLVAGIGDYRR
jgi:hypothetical protein